MDHEYTQPEPTRAEIDATTGPLVLEFGTNWCGFCQAAQPHIEAALAAFPGVEHRKVEDGPGRPLGRSFRVKLWPTLVFLKDGKVLAQVARPGEDDIRRGVAAIADG
jgi:thioredoxin 1